MTRGSGQTIRLLNEERALLMTLAAKRDVTCSDILRIGLYQLAVSEGLHAPLTQALQARIEHVLHVEAGWCGIRLEPTIHPSHTDIMHTGGL